MRSLALVPVLREQAGRAVKARGAQVTEAEREGGELFTELARAVTILGEEQRLGSFTLPYPAAVQLAFDRVVLHCMSRALPLPRSVPELVLWCRKFSVGQWPFALPDRLVTPDAQLVDEQGRMPTRTCLELASAGPLGSVEQEAVDLMTRVEAACQSPELFRKCRDFLIERPVVSRRLRFSPAGRWDVEVWRRVEELYDAVPASLIVRKTFALCATCGLPALLPNNETAQGTIWCESGTCPREVAPQMNYHPGETGLLPTSLRIFLSMPGRTEAKALAKLNRADISAELIPAGLGLHRISTPADGFRILAVYDREQPTLLAARIAETFADSSDHVLVVIPAAVLKRRSDYRRLLEQALPVGMRVSLVTPERLVQAVGTIHLTDQQEENDA